MNGFFSSCQYAPSLSAFILRRNDDDTFDNHNPEGMMKILSREDVLQAGYNDLQRELMLSFRENDTILTIHIPLSGRELSPELREVLRLEEEEYESEFA